MFEKEKSLLNTLQTTYSEKWEAAVLRYLNRERLPEDTDIINSFAELIDSLCDSIKQTDSSLDDAVSLFSKPLQGSIKKVLTNNLRPFFSCNCIRKYETENRGQVETLIDEIWQQKIVRRNPYYEIDPQENLKLVISREDMSELIFTLSSLVDHCISRILTFDGMVYFIRKRTGVSLQLSEYIARKIDRNYEELRTNFIIKRISELSNR